MNGKIASGAGWMVLFKLIDRSLGAISTLILARLLVPEDFGLVAMAMSVLAIIELATSFNFEVALIQRRDIDRAHYDSAWTLNVLLGLACGIVTALLSYPAARFYDEPRLTTILLVLAGAWAVGGFENIGIVDFRRSMHFRREFYLLATKRTLSFLLTVSLALTLQSYWSLVIGSACGRLIGVALTYIMHPFRPRPSFSAARELLGFSGWMLVSNFATVLQAKVPHFVVGRSLGAGSLGVLAVSSEIAQLPSSDVIAPINRALFPGFARMADDRDLLRSTFLDAIAVIVLLVVPAGVGIGAIAEPLVRLLLGEKWLEAVPIIQVLAIATAIAVISSGSSSAFLAMGKPRQWTLLSGVRLAVLVPLVILLTRSMGLVGAALAELAASVLFLGVSVPVMLRHLKVSHFAFFSRIWRPIVSSGLMAVAVALVLRAMPDNATAEAGMQLLSGIAVGLLTYVLMVSALWGLSGRPQGAEAVLLARVRDWRGRHSRQVL